MTEDFRDLDQDGGFSASGSQADGGVGYFVPGASFRTSAEPDPRPESPGVFAQPFRMGVTAPESPESFVHFHASLESRLQNAFDFDIGKPNKGHGFVLGVSSAIAQEGKTATAFHLALAIARNSSHKVGLLDLSMASDPATDLAHSVGLFSAGGFTLAQASSYGIVDILEEKSVSAATFTLAEPDNLVIVPAGSKPVNAARTARSAHLGELIELARNQFTLTIVDLPALSTGFALPIIRQLDGVVMVLRYGVSTEYLATQSALMIGDKKLVGYVLNGYKAYVPNWIAKYVR
jgi:Mrp family chromosome partitioning ATPase